MINNMEKGKKGEEEKKWNSIIMSYGDMMTIWMVLDVSVFGYGCAV